MRSLNPYSSPDSPEPIGRGENNGKKLPRWIEAFLLVLIINFLAFFFAYLIAMTRSPDWAMWIGRFILVPIVSMPYTIGMWLTSDNMFGMFVGIPIAAVAETAIVLWGISLFRLIFKRRPESVAGSAG